MRRLATKYFMLAISLAIFAAPAAEAQELDTLNTCGDIECAELGTYTSDEGFSDFWFLQSEDDADVTFTVVDDPVQEGERALEIDVASIGANPWHIQPVNQTISVTDPVLLTPMFGDYVYSAWLRADQEGGTVNLGVDLDAAYSYSAVIDSVVEVTTDWQQVELEFTLVDTLTDLSTIRAFHSFNQEGNDGITFYLDNVVVAQVEAGGTPAEDLDVPGRFALHQNFPNPFTSSTQISYELGAPSRVTLKVYNMLGQEVATLVDRTQPAGAYNPAFKADDLPSGMYLYRIQAGDFEDTRQMLVVR